MKINNPKFLNLFLLDFQYRYEKWYYLFFEMLAELFGLWVLYQTSLFVVPKMEFIPNLNLNYFEFVFLAEFSIRIPSILIHSSIQSIKFARNMRFLPVLSHSNQSLLQYIDHYILSKFFKELIKIGILFVVTSIFFHLTLTPLNLLGLCLVQMLFFPFFYALSLCSLLIFLHFKRGEGLLMKGFSVLAIFSGLYFPVSFFPQLFSLVSPLTSLIDLSRQVYQHQFSLSLIPCVIFLLGISVLVYARVRFLKIEQFKIYEFDYKI